MKRILIVEDHPSILELYVLLAKMSWMEVTTARDAAHVPANMSSYDVLITDLTLGKGKDGFHVAQLYKKARPTGLVVMVTGHADVQATEDVDVVIQKPFNTEKLLKFLRDL